MEKKRGKKENLKVLLVGCKELSNTVITETSIPWRNHLLQRIKSKHSFRLLISQESQRETCIKQKQCQPLIFRWPCSLSYNHRILCPVIQMDVSLGACVGSTLKMLFRSQVHADIDHLYKSMHAGIQSTMCVCKERTRRFKWHRHFIGYTWRIAAIIPGSDFTTVVKITEFLMQEWRNMLNA